MSQQQNRTFLDRAQAEFPVQSREVPTTLHVPCSHFESQSNLISALHVSQIIAVQLPMDGGDIFIHFANYDWTKSSTGSNFYTFLPPQSLGQKLKFSFSTPKEGNKPEVESMKSSGMSEGNKEKSSTSSSPPTSNINKSLRQQRRRPRFAPELDGVHCFETILPY